MGLPEAASTTTARNTLRALAAEVPNSERHVAALRTKAHLNSCDGGWVNAPVLSHMRLPNTLFAIRLRRYLNLPIPVCEDIGDGAGSSRPPRSGDGKPWQALGPARRLRAVHVQH